VSPSKQIFKCFGCGKGGNVITFMQEIERIDFRDAAKELAKQANIDLARYQIDPNKHDDRNDEKEKIKRIHKIAQKFFIEQLTKHPEAKKYLNEQRKLSDQIINDFGIGYAPDSHYTMIQEFKTKGFIDKDLIDASLAKKSDSGMYTFFKHRITFPIYDTMNNVVGFSARILDPNDKPKYLNSSEHKAFEKSKLLYGLNRAKNDIKQHDALFIVEGQMDVIGLARIGYRLGVATCGTALTQEHLKLIKRYTENLFLLFDNDSAGQEASLRALTLAYQHNLFPKIITLPEGYKDIDELANTADGKEQFDKQRKESQDGFSVVFQNLKKKFDLTSPIDKQKILNILFGLIMNIENNAMQDHYIQVLGEQIGVRENIMEAQYKQFAKSGGKFILQQIARKTEEKKYEIDRGLLVAALFYQDFIKQFIENKDKRIQLLELISKITTTLPDTTMTQSTKDESNHETLLELQLRRDKELNDGKEEDKRYQTIKQIILPVVQGYIQRITKDTTISSDTKQEILNLTKKI
ncbi:MAG TPA: DNA primase, partial [Candidatus Absconditabacterales bacterium]|nr:DNA primase [Candidatus Absconditabacterales bacterium]